MRRRDADTLAAFGPLRYGARHLLTTAETQLASVPRNFAQSRWSYQLSILGSALDQLDTLHEQWLTTQDTLPATAHPGTPDFDTCLAAYHAASWKHLDIWATHGHAVREINAAARTTLSTAAPQPTTAPAAGRTAPIRR